MKPSAATLQLLLLLALSTGASRGAGQEATDLLRIDGEILVEASPADVWAALTTPEGLAGWIAPESSVELRVGGAYELYFTPDEPDRGMEGTRVLAFVPGEMLATTGEAPGTWSVWRLRESAPGTTLVTFTGLGSGDEWAARIGYFRDATPGVLARLRDYVEGSVRGDAADTTPRSDQLRAFREDLVAVDGGGSWWWASNEAYTAEDGPSAPEAYGTRFWLESGSLSASGCLWSIRNGMPADVHWRFYQAWDGARGRPFAYQAHTSGTGSGMGDVVYESASTRIAEQTFWWAGRDGQKIRHREVWNDADTRTTASFVWRDGEWAENRSYTWLRRDGGEVPCGPTA